MTTAENASLRTCLLERLDIAPTLGWGVGSASPWCALRQGPEGGEFMLAIGSSLWIGVATSLKVWPSTIAFLS